MIHRMHSIKPIAAGVFLLTDILKSFIQFAVFDWFRGTASFIIVPMGEDALLRFLNHAKNCGKQIGRTRRKGTASKPSSKYHKL